MLWHMPVAWLYTCPYAWLHMSIRMAIPTFMHMFMRMCAHVHTELLLARGSVGASMVVVHFLHITRTTCFYSVACRFLNRCLQMCLNMCGHMPTSMSVHIRIEPRDNGVPTSSSTISDISVPDGMLVELMGGRFLAALQSSRLHDSGEVSESSTSPTSKRLEPTLVFFFFTLVFLSFCQSRKGCCKDVELLPPAHTRQEFVLAFRADFPDFAGDRRPSISWNPAVRSQLAEESEGSDL